jgi:hypothetical protein
MVIETRLVGGEHGSDFREAQLSPRKTIPLAPPQAGTPRVVASQDFGTEI